MVAEPRNTQSDAAALNAAAVAAAAVAANGAGGSDAPLAVGHSSETVAAVSPAMMAIPLRPANMAKLILQREVSGTSYSITLCQL
jgi:hypothetical protein